MTQRDWTAERTEWLVELARYGEEGATKEQHDAIVKQTGYRYWSGTLNGNGLSERTPTGNLRLSPLGAAWAAIEIGRRRYKWSGPLWDALDESLRQIERAYAGTSSGRHLHPA